MSFSTPEELLLHRTPFLFLDSLVEVDEHHTVGVRKFRPDEFFFSGHFPEYPVVPGVILIETMAQCGGAGLRQMNILPPGALFVLASVEKVKFRKQVRPGDIATIAVQNLRVSQQVIRQKGTITVEGELAAEATWMCILSDTSPQEESR